MKKPYQLVLALSLLAGLVLPTSLLASPQPGNGAHKVAVSQVDINTASSEELQLIPGIGITLAERIISYRTEHGAFKAAAELTAIRGIGEKSLAKLRPWVKVK